MPFHVEAVRRIRKFRPLFFIDIAVPRDIDPAVGDIEEVYLYDIDTLEQLADEAQRILREIIDHEQSMLTTLTMQRDAVAAQLQQGRDSVLATHAYNSQALLESSTLDISD